MSKPCFIKRTVEGVDVYYNVAANVLEFSVSESIATITVASQEEPLVLDAQESARFLLHVNGPMFTLWSLPSA